MLEFHWKHSGLAIFLHNMALETTLSKINDYCAGALSPRRFHTRHYRANNPSKLFI